ncbi:MAG: sulfatase [Planctomycetes bacterium]|nr:sulfatase [Planctomycetota bacterium]
MHATLRLAVAALLMAVFAPLGLAADARPNVLFIAVDDLNHWVGHLARNDQTKTPNIDRLAGRGVTFTRAYCAAPVCNPSRAALMSGMRPSTTGVYSNGNDWRTAVSEELPLTTAFRKAGYYVAGSGKIYHGSFPRRSEWDDYLQNEGGNPAPTGNDGVGGIKFAPLDCKDEDLADYRIVDYAIAQLQKKHDKPFFLACGMHKPHMPWNVPRKYYDMFPLDQIKLPPYQENDLADIPPAGVQMAKPEGDHRQMLESGRWKEAVQAYLATIAYSDMNLGRLLDALDKSAYRDNTIICYWGDHGWHLGEKHHWRKFALWEEATRAPLIWVAPGVTKAGGVSQRTVDFMSIYPTLTDLCGIPTPAHVEGKSIRSLLANPSAEWSQPALTTHGYKNHAARSEGWRYIRYANGDEELYDETKDPYEWTNLADKPELAAKKSELAATFPLKDAPTLPNAGADKEKNKQERQKQKQNRKNKKR